MNLRIYKNYIKELNILAFPILTGNLGQMLIGIGDVFVAGRYSTEGLGAISIANAIFFCFLIMGLGFVYSIVPVISNMRGEKKDISSLFLPTLIYSFFVSIVVFLALRLFIPFVYKIGLNPVLVDDCANYLIISSYSIFGMIFFGAMKEFLQSFEIVILPNVLITISVFLNVFLNFVFVYGLLHVKEFGILGLAYASLVTRTLIALILFFPCIRFIKSFDLVYCKKFILDLLKIGAPIAGACFVEYFGFNIIAILVGRFEAVYAACHNIIIAIVSFFYMFPYSIQSALSVKVGFANGSKNLDEIKKYIKTAFFLVFAYALCVVLIYLLFKREIISIFTSDPKAIEIGVLVMFIVACFVIFDCLQAVFMGALRGLKETFAIMLIMFFSYFLVSIPTGLILALKFNMVLDGFWIGLAFGSFVVAFSSFIVLYKKYKRLKKEFKLNSIN